MRVLVRRRAFVLCVWNAVRLQSSLSRETVGRRALNKKRRMPIVQLAAAVHKFKDYLGIRGAIPQTNGKEQPGSQGV